MRLKIFLHLKAALIAFAILFMPDVSLADRPQLKSDGYEAVELFRFEDYDDKQMREFINQHFLPGTRKEFIDLVLIEKGGAVQTAIFKDRPVIGLSQVIYRYKYNGYYDCSRALAVPFDANNKVAGSITLHGGCL